MDVGAACTAPMHINKMNKEVIFSNGSRLVSPLRKENIFFMIPVVCLVFVILVNYIIFSALGYARFGYLGRSFHVAKIRLNSGLCVLILSENV